MSRTLILLLIVHIHQAFNIPLTANEKEAHFKPSPNHILPIANSNHVDHKQTMLIPLVSSQHVTFVDSKPPTSRKKKGPNVPLSLPIPHHLLLSTNLHVIPIHQNIHHNTIHTGVSLITNDHVNLPIVSHTFAHSTSNVTHQTPLILIPIHTHLVPLHDLTVIPLHRAVHKVNLKPKLSHYRTAADKRSGNDDEVVNRFRYFGGYGNGLDFGGHGAGHGFYAVGSWA